MPIIMVVGINIGVHCTSSEGNNSAEKKLTKYTLGTLTFSVFWQIVFFSHINITGIRAITYIVTSILLAMFDLLILLVEAPLETAEFPSKMLILLLPLHVVGLHC